MTLTTDVDDVASQPTDDDPTAQIEREVTLLIRRAETAVARRPVTERLVRSAYLLLSHLESSGPLGIAAVAEATQIDISTASRQIIPLERQGLVRRLSNPADGRGSLIEITSLGLDRLQRTREERHEVFVELLRGWSGHDRAAFAEYLRRLNSAIVKREASRTAR